MSDETTSQALADLVREGATGEVTPAVHAAGRARWLDAVTKPARPAVSWPGLAVAVAFVFVLAFYLRWHRAPLTFADEGTALTFSDGTRVVLEPSARARVVDVTADGGRIVLDDGALDVDVVHTSGARWTFVAGPYTVAVTGTAFVIKYSSAGERLDVEMERGSVRVDGPRATGVVVVAGQSLEASPSSLAVHSRVEGSPAETEKVPPVETVAEPTPVESAPKTDVVQPREAPPVKTWSERVSAGEYAAVVRDAEGAHFDEALARRPLADLVALADAARYARRFDVAARALAAERSRFAGSAEARAAAFMLGRTAEDTGDASGALAHYDDYLRESPDGALAAEALGRKLALLRAAKRTDEARPVAREYLRRFPSGGYSHVAHEVVSTP